MKVMLVPTVEMSCVPGMRPLASSKTPRLRSTRRGIQRRALRIVNLSEPLAPSASWERWHPWGFCRMRRTLLRAHIGRPLRFRSSLVAEGPRDLSVLTLALSQSHGPGGVMESTARSVVGVPLLASATDGAVATGQDFGLRRHPPAPPFTTPLDPRVATSASTVACGSLRAASARASQNQQRCFRGWR